MSLPVIAIDGPGASGKSSTGEAVARALGFLHLDSGALYRAITLVALGLPDRDEKTILGELNAKGVGLVPRGTDLVPWLNGSAVGEEIRSPLVTAHVSEISALPGVRRWATERFREAIRRVVGGVVVDGRDIGTVVFPEAALKVFLVADPRLRAERRLRQRGESLTAERVAEETERLQGRDEADATRQEAPLRPAEDAVQIDTSPLTLAEQVDRIVELARAHPDL